MSVGGSIVEALLWGRGVSTTWRRATVVRAGQVHELTADADPGRARSPPAGVAARARPRGHPLGPGGHRPPSSWGPRWSTTQIAYLTSDAPADSPWVSSYG